MSYKYCCDDFASARENGTDNEEYGKLIWAIRGKWYAGNEDRLPPLAHCPWCGVKLRDPLNNDYD